MKTCEYCGTVFAPSTDNQKYCSKECNREADKKNKRERYAKEHRIGETRICIICGKEFLSKSEKGQTCSRKCGRMLSNMKNGHCQYDYFFKLPLKAECPTCGKIFATSSRRKIYCSDECYKRTHDRRLNENNIVDNDITLKKLFYRDNGTCAICGGKCDFEDYKVKNGKFCVGRRYPTVDHIFPLSKGGKHSWKNIQLAHQACNSKKGSSTTLTAVYG